MLKSLNKEQREVADIINGSAVVYAGPGSGKTGTTVTRIANMIVNHGVPPESIVALTFTNAAADEMRQRIAKQVGEEGYKVFTGTYHSYFIQNILTPNRHHEYFQRTGYSDGFYVMTENDSDRLMNIAIKAVPPHVKGMLDALDIGRKKIKTWMSNHRSNGLVANRVLRQFQQDEAAMNAYKRVSKHVSVAMADGAKPHELAQQLMEFRKQSPQFVDVAMGLVWREYTKECASASGMDFDDVLVHAARLMQYAPQVGEKIARRHQYFNLDEFQDTNPVQFDVVAGIVKHHKGQPNVLAVGDARQSIYGFRNADVRIMLNMDKHIPGTRLVSLKTNYRSSQELLDATNALAKVMNNQVTDGQLRSAKGNYHTKPQILAFDDERDEAKYVVREIRNLIQGGTSPEDIVVLYRARSAREAIEQQLVDNEVSYQIIGDVSFWERKEIQDCLALTRALVRERDTMALYRVLDSGTYGVTPLTLKKNAAKAGMDPKKYLFGMALGKGARAQQIKPLVSRLKAFEKAVPLFDKRHMAKEGPIYYSMLMNPHYTDNQHTMFANEMDADTRQEAVAYGRQLGEYNAGMIASTIKAVYDDLMWPKLMDAETKRLKKAGLSAGEIGEKITERRDSINKFFEVLSELQTESKDIHHLVDELTLRAEASQENRSDQVKLMTNHASKGLEKKAVFMIASELESYLRDGNDATQEQIDEEFRNFYVAATRAEENLYISYAETRLVNGEVRAMRPFPGIEFMAPHCDFCNERSDERAKINELNDLANLTNAAEDDLYQSFNASPSAVQI